MAHRCFDRFNRILLSRGVDLGRMQNVGRAVASMTIWSSVPAAWVRAHPVDALQGAISYLLVVAIQIGQEEVSSRALELASQSSTPEASLVSQRAGTDRCFEIQEEPSEKNVHEMSIYVAAALTLFIQAAPLVSNFKGRAPGIRQSQSHRLLPNHPHDISSRPQNDAARSAHQTLPGSDARHGPGSCEG